MIGAPHRSHRDHAPEPGRFRSRRLSLLERLALPWDHYPRGTPDVLIRWIDDAAERRIRRDPGLVAWLERGLDRVVEVVLATIAAGALVLLVQVVILLVRWLS